MERRVKGRVKGRARRRVMHESDGIEWRNGGSEHREGVRGAHDLVFSRTIDDDELEETTVSTQYPALESRSGANYLH